MDYTTLATVRAALRVTSENAAADALIARVITAASRLIDSQVAQVGSPESTNYLKRETVTGEILFGDVDLQGRLVLFPHKPLINSVASLELSYDPDAPAVTGNVQKCVIGPGPMVTYWGALPRVRHQAIISYNGGIAEAVESLPADLVEIATVLAIRLYKDIEAGESDVVGLGETGQLMYTKAIPERVKMMLVPYMRQVRW